MARLATFLALLPLALPGVLGPALAADGSLDPTFGTGGRVATAVGPTNSGAWAVAVQPDGKIVAAGHTGWSGLSAGSFALTRHQANGALDPTFGFGGRVTTAVPGTGHATDVLVQPDGKIVAVGYSALPQHAVLIRYLPDGSLDPTFGNGGIAEGPEPWSPHGAALLSSGKILVAGQLGAGVNYRAVVGRFNADGTIDTTFGTGGFTIESIGYGAAWEGDVAVAPDEATFYVSGSAYREGPGRYAYESDFLVGRYLANGTLDPTFGEWGVASVDFGTEYSDYELGLAGALQSDGRFVVAGPVGNFGGVARLEPDGSLDASFGEQGRVLLGQFLPQFAPRDLVIEVDGKIVLGGYSSRGANGTPFGFALPPSELALTRLEPDGDVDATFAPCPQVTLAFPGFGALGLALARQADGRYVLAGETLDAAGTMALARFGTATTPACQPAAAGKSKLVLRQFPDGERDQLAWRWTSSGEVTPADLGDPTGDTGYTLCVLSNGGDVRGGSVRRDGWSAAGTKGHRFAGKGTSESPITRASVLRGGAGKGKILVKGKGEYLEPGLPLTTPVTVRLVRDDAPVCWEATFGANVKRSDGAAFVARSD